MQQINGDLDLDCQTFITEPNPRFKCTGSLPARSQFSEDQGSLNEHLNARLDSFIVATVEDGEINNFEDMTCYFTNATGSPPVADLYCEGPLRPRPSDQETTTIEQIEDETVAFAFTEEVEDQAYTAGTTISALELPEATGGEGEVTYRVSDLPAGLTFDAATRMISGTPEAATDGAVEVTYTAQDSTGAAATLTFSITVNPPLSFGDLFGLLNGGASEEDAGGG